MAELKALVSEYRENPPANAALKVRYHAPPFAHDMHTTMIAAPQEPILRLLQGAIAVPSSAS